MAKLADLDDDRLAAFERLIDVKHTPWSLIHKPTPKQHAFLALDHVIEAFYGGAAGGGKSDALLMGAAQYVDVPGYAALLLRRNFKQLALPGSLMDRSKEWWRKTAAEWNEGSKKWTFPSGATITFGHVQNPADVSQYESAEFQYIGFDEVTQFEESVYQFLFSRLRRTHELAEAGVPLRMRSASNPRGVGFTWVKRRFVSPDTREPGAKFIPARLVDNPFLDFDEYLHSLSHLPPVLREKLLHGDWEIMEAGEMFDPWGKVDLVAAVPRHRIEETVRAWDLGFAAKTDSNDPDWTVGVKMSRDVDGEYWIEHVERFREDPGATERRIRQVAEGDGEQVRIGIERMPGAGKSVWENYRRKVLRGFNVIPLNPQGMTKVERAGTYAGAMGSGLIHAVNGPWIDEFFTTHVQFPDEAPHDDDVDAATYAYRMVSGFESKMLEYERGGNTTGHRHEALKGRR